MLRGPMPGPRGLSTLSVHGPARRGAERAIEAPLVLSSAFRFEDAEEAAAAFRGENDAYIYARWGSPTTDDLAERVALLEGADDAAVLASGMAAVTGTIVSVCRQGGHVVAPRAMYAEAARLFRERLPALGIRTTFLDDPGPETYAAAIERDTRVLYVETPANPTLAVVDLAGVAEVARERGLVSVADNTFATPYCQRPIAHGFDLVLHSMTKFLGGHGDAVGGAVAGKRALVSGVRDVGIKAFGAALAPFSAFLIARGLRTFALRMAQATRTATTLARKLAAHPAIEVVHHPSLPTHPGHAIAARQMTAMPAILSFEVRGGVEAGRRVLEGVQLVTHAVSLGDVRSLLTHPASTVASTMPPDDRRRAHIRDGLLRLAVGIEDEADLAADLFAALEGAA